MDGFLFFRRWQRTSSGVPRLCFAQDFEAAIPRPHIRQDTVSGQRPAAVRASGPDAIQCSRAEPPGSRRPRSGLRFCSAKGFGVIIPQPPKPKGSEDGAAAAVLPHAKPDAIQCSRAEPSGSRRPQSGLRFCFSKRLRGYYSASAVSVRIQSAANGHRSPRQRTGCGTMFSKRSRRLQKAHSAFSFALQKASRLLYHLPAEKANLRWQDSHILYGLFPTV